MNPTYSTPSEAVFGLIQAYCSLDPDEIIRNKDFELDAQFYFEETGLPVSEEQQNDATAAFEKNFRMQLEEGIPDYRPVQFQVTEEDALQEDFVIVTLSGKAGEHQFELQIPVFHRPTGWVVVLHPAYNHL